MSWSQIEDKINFFLNNKWEKFLRACLFALRKIKIFIKRKTKELMSINLSKVKEDLVTSVPIILERLRFYRQEVPKKVSGYFNEFRKKDKGFKGATALVSFFLFGYLSALQVFSILDKSRTPERSPASISVNENHRPTFYNDEKKQITIYNINIPILVDKNRLTKSIIVDFTVQLSSRYSKKVLEGLHHELNDHINTNTAPIVKYFPLTDEGKSIIKDKLIDSLQMLLDKKEITAKVKDIFIISILSS